MTYKNISSIAWSKVFFMNKEELLHDWEISKNLAQIHGEMPQATPLKLYCCCSLTRILV